HSIVGIPILSLLLAAVMSRFSGKFLGHFAIALIAATTHPLLDFANTYGMRPLFPLESRWVYGDTLFVIDPYLDLLLVGCLIIGGYCKRRELAAIVTLVLMLGYVVAHVELRNIARVKVQEFATKLTDAESFSVSPRMLTPFVWTGIIETHDAIFSVDVDIF